MSVSSTQIGARTLFDDIVNVDTTDYPLRVVKGRSERLDNLRNEFLSYRYIFLMNITGWRYDLLTKALAKEFFLAERTVINLLDENLNLVKLARQQNLSSKQLQKKWPHYSWEKPELEHYC